jgi:ATP-dependent Clp protease protease subunit
MSNHYFKIKAADHGSSADVYIYDSIGGDGGITAKDFAAELKMVGLVDKLNVFINSDGGSVFEGMTIHEHLRRHPAYVTVHVDGVAASIASVIAMAGDEIIMAANSLLMVHDPWMTTSGTADDLQKSVELINKVKEQILKTYMRRTGSDRDVIADLMAKETWMDAAEAIALGFADEVSEPQQLAASYDLSRFRNPPNEMAHRYGVSNYQRSRSRSQIAIRAKVAYCQKQAMKILLERNQVN